MESKLSPAGREPCDRFKPPVRVAFPFSFVLNPDSLLAPEAGKHPFLRKALAIMIKNILCLYCPQSPEKSIFQEFVQEGYELGGTKMIRMSSPQESPLKCWGPSLETLAELKVDIYLHIIKMPPPFTSFMKEAYSRLLNEPHM